MRESNLETGNHKDVKNIKQGRVYKVVLVLERGNVASRKDMTDTRGQLS